MADEPITREWLWRNGWRIEDHRNDYRLPLMRRCIADELADYPQAFRSNDDLCIDVSMWTVERWHCRIMQVEPYRRILVRHIRWTWELVKLYEGLTGREWNPGKGPPSNIDELLAANSETPLTIPPGIGSIVGWAGTRDSMNDAQAGTCEMARSRQLKERELYSSALGGWGLTQGG
jgi:hypothetical protein